MPIEVHCFATLARFSPADAATFAIDPGETAGSVIFRLGIPAEEIKLLFVNGAQASADTVLRDGDRLGVFPAVGGG